MVQVNEGLVKCSAMETVGETSLTLSSPPKMIEKCFGCSGKNKFQLVKKMIKNDTDIKYCITDNTVLEIKLSAANEIQQLIRQKQLCALIIRKTITTDSFRLPKLLV